MTRATHPKRRRLAWTVALLVLGVPVGVLLLNHVGCGPARPVVTVAATAGDLMAGSWEGTWSSTVRDMGGKLRCEVRRADGASYQADFHSTYAKVLTDDSSVTLQVRKEGDKWRFEGQKDLGVLKGGVYTYQGYVTSEEFYSTYDARYDRGIFRMRRPGAASQPHAGVQSPAATRPNPSAKSP